MKICLLADGESIHTQRWCQHFFELGHDVHLITFKQVKIVNIKVYCVSGLDIKVSGGNWKVVLKYKQVKDFITQIKPDVLHSLYATSYGLLGALSGFKNYIVTPLGTDVLISPNQSFIYRAILKFVFKKAKIITSMAPHMKEAMLKYGAKNEKITDIVLGINTSIFNKNLRELPPNEFVICSTRNFEPVYNIPHFLNAIALIKDEIPNLKVNIIGDGSLKSNLVELSKQLNIENKVTFFGKVPQSKVVDILNHSHVFVTVSLSDGNSLSLIEAMACGAYPVATDILANKQWITDGVNGSFVKINDAQGLANCLIAIYKNYNSMINTALIESDKLIIEKGTWNVNMSKMETIYKSFIL
jgi:glycosyltransferase involved in cell wall biosynthesis